MFKYRNLLVLAFAKGFLIIYNHNRIGLGILIMYSKLQRASSFWFPFDLNPDAKLRYPLL